MDEDEAKFEDLIGYTLREIKVDRGGDNEATGDQIHFFTQGGQHFRLWHRQDCCETVAIEDITGHVEDLLGLPILQAEEASNKENKPEGADSHTWTFYKLATNRGRVTIRWLGESNGYYSESVDFEKVENAT